MRLADLIPGLTAIKVLKEFNDETTLFRLTSALAFVIASVNLKTVDFHLFTSGPFFPLPLPLPIPF